METFGIISIFLCIYLQYSESKNPARFPPCMYEKPLKDPATNKTLDCWSNGTPDVCPYSYECKYDPAGIYSVCCKKEYEYNPCVYGSPLKQKDYNLTVKCGFEPGDEDCPLSHVCKIDPNEAYAVCCPQHPRPRPLTGIFTQQRTSQSAIEEIILCNSKVPCPYTHECIQIKSGQLNGYCKVRENTEKSKVINPCASGVPYSHGQEPIFCGRGKNHEDCPLSYECRIDPADNYAVCCPREEKFNPCTLQEPYMIGNQSVYCGEGPKHKDCPESYSCTIDPDGAYAVCCRKYHF